MMTYPSVILVDYDPRWPRMFAEEKERILAVLGPLAVGVEHVGSTSVPGLGAKPIIDIVVGVRDLATAFELCRRPLQRIAYEYIPMPSFPDRRFFQRGPWRQGTHHLHLTEYAGSIWRDYLLFRDHLRQRPEVAQQYFAFKQRLAARPNIDRAAYSAAKCPFIQGVIGQVLEEQSNSELSGRSHL